MPKHGDALTGLDAYLYHLALDLSAKAGIYPAATLVRVADALDAEARAARDPIDFRAVSGLAAMFRAYAEDSNR